jgi:Ca2+-binding EF-hand superfamily protein
MRSLLLALGLLSALPAAAQAPGGPALDAQVNALFDRSDADRDGELTPAEWQAAGRTPQGFLMMDGDGNGRVTRAEAQAGMAKAFEEPLQKPN